MSVYWKCDSYIVIHPRYTPLGIVEFYVMLICNRRRVSNVFDIAQTSPWVGLNKSIFPSIWRIVERYLITWRIIVMWFIFVCRRLVLIRHSSPKISHRGTVSSPRVDRIISSIIYLRIFRASSFYCFSISAVITKRLIFSVSSTGVSS